MRLHIVAFIRDHRIETVVKITKSLTSAQSAFINSIKNCKNGSEEDAKDILADFSDRKVTDNVTFIMKDAAGDLYLQLFTWDEKLVVQS